MEISPEEIRHIADLARMELKPEETEAFRARISSILEYVGQLSECRTEGVEPMAHVAPLANVLRPDEVDSSDADTRGRLLDSFPDREGDLLKVKAIFSQD
jgi:aspartyl-tRNA(Asn)/glutamyl-tRNA(Gln) amidotransferase subunit C